MAEPLIELGRRLKAARESKGWTVQQASERTRITGRNLAAIESGELSRFPAAVYVRGFVRSYANALDLDEQEQLKLLDEAGFTAPSAAVPRPGTPGGEAGAEGAETAVASRFIPAPGTIATAVVVLVAAVGVGIGIRTFARMSKANGETQIPPSPFQTQGTVPERGREAAGASTGAAPAAPAARPAGSAPALSASVQVSVTAHATCEMQYQPDSRRARWMTLKPGETVVLKAKSQLRLLIGNPAGIELSTAQGPVPMPRKSYRAEHLMITAAGVQKLALPLPSSTVQ